MYHFYLSSLKDLKIFLYHTVEKHLNSKEQLKESNERISLFPALIKLLDQPLADLQKQIPDIYFYIDKIFADDDKNRQQYKSTLPQIYILMDSTKLTVLEKGEIFAEYAYIIETLKEEYEKAKQKLEADYQALEQEAANIRIYRKINSSLKYGKLVSQPEIRALEKLFDDSQIDKNNQKAILDEIQKHNQTLWDTQSLYINDQTSKELDLINTFGYEVLEENDDYHSDSTLIQQELKKILVALANFEKQEDIQAYLLYILTIRKSDYHFVDAVLIALLKHLQSQLVLSTDMIKYADFGEIHAIHEEFETLLDLYLTVHHFYDNDFKAKEPEYDDDNEMDNVNILLFPKGTEDDSYILADLQSKNMPKEYLGKIPKLLEQFKNGELSNKKLKMLINNNNYKGVLEIKDDQIRIIMKQLSGPYYCVLGVGIKKDDNDIPMYNRIIARPVLELKDDKDLSEALIKAEEIEGMINEYCCTNQRKGSR